MSLSVGYADPVLLRPENLRSLGSADIRSVRRPDRDRGEGPVRIGLLRCMAASCLRSAARFHLLFFFAADGRVYDTRAAAAKLVAARDVA